MIRAHRAVALSLLGASLLPSRALWAQAADARCQAEKETAELRARGRYRRAREILLECVNAPCGGEVRRRCAAELQRLDPIIPSIVVRAEDADGNDVEDVSVRLEDAGPDASGSEGELLVSSLDGMAIPVDPGEHHFVFERAGEAPVERTLTIREGEKFRPIDVIIGARADAEVGALSATGAAGAGGDSERLVASATLIGVGVVGVASYAWLGLRARAGEDALARCEPTCSPGRVDSVEKRYLLANISLGAGVLALGAATWLLLSDSGGEEEAPAAASGLSLGADGSGAYAVYFGQF